MIRNQRYVVLDSREVGKKPLGVRRMGEAMVFWRDKSGGVHCAIDRCPHRGAALSAGSVIDGRIQCPFHGFEYGADGTCVYIPANGRGGVIPKAMCLKTYPTYEAHGFIWIFWGDRLPIEPPLFFDNLDDSFFYGTASDPWDIHYSRAVENQLDVVHLPFVHRNTIGRGNRTVVDSPVVEWRGEKMLYTYVYNRMDDGAPPRKPSELSIKDARSVHLEFIMPNLWQNYISPIVRVVIAFVPVDEVHTLLYLRFYQKFLPIPFLGNLIAQWIMPLNIYIAHEDRHVVITQRPKASSLKNGEVLIQGDLPIMEYRRKRALLQEETQKLS